MAARLLSSPIVCSCCLLMCDKKMEEERLIEVEKYPELKDPQSCRYKDNGQKDIAWGVIALEIGSSGRVSFFSSGSENLHRVEKVTWGTRFAITVSFTCDPAHAISDPAMP